VSHDPLEDTAPDSVPTVQPSDGGDSVSSPPLPGEHWLPRSLGKLGAYALAAPLAYRLPDLLLSGHTWPAVIAGTVILAVAAPRTIRDVAELARSIRSGGK
jgi:hypothetical protein